MIKIETAPVISDEFPAGRANEFIWMEGQQWPVKAEDDSRLARMEIFGPELENVHVRSIGGGTTQTRKTGNGDQEQVILRSMKGADVRYFSQQMRVFYP